tara:strand:+ start:1247 stop:1462 length:216 start_codon:yes stop_codon:yes gene_type:complete
MSKKKPKTNKGWYYKNGKKVSTKEKHSETYSNEVYKYVKEGGDLGGAGKGDADRTSNRNAYRDNYEEIFNK